MTGPANLFHHRSGTQESICSPPLWEGSPPEGSGGMDFFRGQELTHHCRAAAREARDPLLTSQRGFSLNSKTPGPLQLLPLPFKGKEKWTMEERKTVLSERMISKYSGGFVTLPSSP